MTCVPAIMPTAKTPTAIESTTRLVRTLLLDRSRNILRHRGLAMRDHLLFSLACSAVLQQTFADDTVDRFPGGRRFNHQPPEFAAVKRDDLHAGITAGPHSCIVGAAAQ